MDTMATPRRSETVDLLRLLLTVGIVFRHAELVGQTGMVPAYDAVNRGMMLLTELCVPLFFALSGFLYFRNIPDHPGPRFFWGKIRRRLSSLLIPYLIANAVAFLCYWAAYSYAPTMMSGYFGDNWRNPFFVFWSGPVNLSLWFIRDLFIAILCAPLYWLLIRFTRFWAVLAGGLAWYLFGTPAWCNFFFLLGAWAAICKIDVPHICRRTAIWCLALYAGCFIAALYIRSVEIIKLSVLTGLPLCIAMTDKWSQISRRRLPVFWQGWCFFIYLYHYIPILTLKKILLQGLHPHNFITLSGVYVLTALLTLGIISGLYTGMRYLAPRLTKIIIGGR